MGKKRAKPVSTVGYQELGTGKPVRLNLSEADHKRLSECARTKGLNKASYARMAVLERIKADEESAR